VGEIPPTDWMRLSHVKALIWPRSGTFNVGLRPTIELSSCAEDIPSTELSPEWGHIPTSKYGRNPVEKNYKGFILPWVHMRGARRLAYLSGGNIPSAEQRWALRGGTSL